MKISIKLIYILLCTCASVYAQNDTIRLKEVKITSNRIALPFSKESRTINLITSEQIQNSPASNVADLLQNIIGIDI